MTINYKPLLNVIKQSQTDSNKFAPDDLEAQRDILFLMSKAIDRELARIVKSLDGNPSYCEKATETAIQLGFQY